MSKKKKKSYQSPTEGIKINRTFKPKSQNQAEYVRSIIENDIVFCCGPAGSGKTACSVGLAVEHLLHGKVEKIIITRPTIGTDEEYSEGIGFLPGDMLEKMDPYLRPIYDEVKTYVGNDMMKRWLYEEILEVAPLDFMRGRTFHNAFVIMDEAQNATHNQIKMFTTRLGNSSKMVVNGDIKQHDRRSQECALHTWMNEIINKVSGIGVIRLEKTDIVRNKIVSDILTSAEEYEKTRPYKS